MVGGIGAALVILLVVAAGGILYRYICVSDSFWSIFHMICCQLLQLACLLHEFLFVVLGWVHFTRIFVSCSWMYFLKVYFVVLTTCVFSTIWQLVYLLHECLLVVVTEVSSTVIFVKCGIWRYFLFFASWGTHYRYIFLLL